MNLNSAALWGGRLMPRSWPRGAIVVLAGYIDGSNLHQNADVIAVAGCVASVEKWTLWEDHWKTLLASPPGLGRWHHTDFMARRYGKTGHWGEPDWLVSRRLLCEAFESIQPICFGSTIRRVDFDDLRSRYPIMPDDPYYFLLDRALHRLVQGLFEHPKDEGILIFCDQDKDEALVKELATWHTHYLRADPKVAARGDEKRKIITSYGSNVEFMPLQAADVVAHELMRFARANPQMNFVPSNRPTQSWILDRLVKSMPFLVETFSREIFEMELNGTAFVPGHPPGLRFVPDPEAR